MHHVPLEDQHGKLVLLARLDAMGDPPLCSESLPAIRGDVKIPRNEAASVERPSALAHTEMCSAIHLELWRASGFLPGSLFPQDTGEASAECF